MNTIKFIDEKLEIKNLDNNIEIEFIEKSDLYVVNTINIIIKSSTELKIIYKSEKEIKTNIHFTIEKNVNFVLDEHRIDNFSKNKYTSNRSKLSFCKFISQFYFS